MGRRIPSEVDPLIHPALSLSLFAAWIAATMAIFAALCGFKSRKSPPQQSSPSSSPRTGHNSPVRPTTTATDSPKTTTTVAEMAETPEEPSSPVDQQKQHRRSATTILVSKGKLIKSLSMKIPGSSAMARYKARREEHQQQKQEEESIWKKTIILGERCRVPDEDDAINYDEKGNRIAAYPARTPRSMPVSRTNSFFNPDGNF